MNVEKIESQTAVLHLPVTVEDDDAPELKRILQTLFEEGMQFIHVDFTMTKYMRTPGPGLLTLYQKSLQTAVVSLSSLMLKTNTSSMFSTC